MRGIQTPVRNVRRRIFKEIAKFGYEQRNLQDLEDLPYEIIPGEVAKYRDSIYRERAIVGERLRLAMGMSLNPADKPTRITKGIDESNISEKYYEPPLLQVIPSACNECKEKAFIVGEQCQGCMAHPCMEVCPKKAISFKDGYSYIDQEKCIKCGQCKKVCPYGAIYERRRPCANAVVLADSIVENVLQPLLTPVITLVLFFLFYALLRLLVSMLVTVLGLVNKLPVIGTVNRGLGWLVGAGTALLDVYLVLCILWGLIVITGGSLNVINDTVMSTSLYYKIFNLFNPFL